MTTDSNEVSVYSGDLTKAEIVKQTALIGQAFPKMPKTQIDLLREMFIQNGFNDQRMIDSVKHVICTYEGWDKSPNIANFIQYDKTVEHHSYHDLLEATNKFDPTSRKAYLESYIAIKVNNQQRFVLKTDQQKYNFEVWK